MPPDHRLPPPPFELEIPGTYLFSGPASTRGYALNRFALSLRSAAARSEFLRDEPAYLARFDLSPQVEALIAARDWSGLMRAGGHVQALLKLAAAAGGDLFDIGAHHCGTERAALIAACPRTVSGLADLDG